MAELRNCSECGRLFAYVGRNLCSKCLEQEEKDYTIVRRYVRDHSGASVFEVADATGIEEEKILQFLRDGRLQSKGFANIIECERCGTRISSGRFCDSCLGQLDKEIRGIISGNKQPVDRRTPTNRKNDKIHILDSKPTDI
jgi:flagellar operon protein (TIGR03826 family)